MAIRRKNKQAGRAKGRKASLPTKRGSRKTRGRARR